MECHSLDKENSHLQLPVLNLWTCEMLKTTNQGSALIIWYSCFLAEIL